MSYGKSSGIRDRKLGVSTPMKKGTTHGKYCKPGRVPGDYMKTSQRGTSRAKGKGPRSA